ncbi:hypothetical protein C8F01DRAFT_1259171 [Mycena amicta]|nr:hypothetical protein C8F01DRAFT_1259171 [Mycena amicta]
MSLRLLRQLCLPLCPLPPHLANTHDLPVKSGRTQRKTQELRSERLPEDKSDDDDNKSPVKSKLKGWARGVREDKVLKKHIEPYRRARQMGTRDAEDYLQMVCNEYCYRIPYDLPDGEEPSLPLREWTPTTPPGDNSNLSSKERKKKESWIVWMMPRIKRWLDYRSQGGTHATAATGKKLDPNDPINIMLFQIANTLPAHRARQGWQQFWHEEVKTTIEDEVQPYLDRAAAEKARDVAAFDAAMKAWPPKDPIAIQAAIDNLEPTIGRFMQGVTELTNMHVVMALGGPSPRFHGTLHTVHYSAGENNAPSPVAFPDWDAGPS